MQFSRVYVLCNIPRLNFFIGMSRAYPVILSIAGSDPSGGAGIQADMKTAWALGVYALTAVTAVTAQNTCCVKSMAAVPPSLLESQLETAAEDIIPDVVKIGLIPDETSANVIADFLEKLHKPVVVDPVIASTSGHLFSSSLTLDVMKRRLFPLVTLLTPNLPEASIIIGKETGGSDCIHGIAEAIIESYGCGGVLIKGGHGEGDILTDTLLLDERVSGKRIKKEYSHPRISTPNTHGTGCTLSSAIASFMARGLSVAEAVGEGISYLGEVLKANRSVRLGHGHGPVGSVPGWDRIRNKTDRNNENQI